jgi:Rps23 Pro-64 3,4-dihydroxylase Tpa1-like proline 4-hydroxylase
LITVYDNAFPYNYSCFVWNFVKTSLYKVGWRDDTIPEHSEYLCLHSEYSQADQEILQIREKLDASPAGEKIHNKTLAKMIVNLSIPGQTHFEHTHNVDGAVLSAPDPERYYDVCLYYPALEWKREWGGETMFYSADNLELERAVEYRPNRLVHFTGEHSHSVRPATLHAPFYRFTISMFFSSRDGTGDR